MGNLWNRLPFLAGGNKSSLFRGGCLNETEDHTKAPPTQSFDIVHSVHDQNAGRVLPPAAGRLLGDGNDREKPLPLRSLHSNGRSFHTV